MPHPRAQPFPKVGGTCQPSCPMVPAPLPASYIVNAADLLPRHDSNVTTKFADGTCLIIPARNSHTRDDEVSHVKSWASNNNLQLNCSKSHVIVFRSRRLRGKADQTVPPCQGPDLKRVDKLTILGARGVYTRGEWCEMHHGEN